MPVSRRPAWLPGLAALFFALLTAGLGNWQLNRAQEKRDLQGRFELAARLPVLATSAALPQDDAHQYRWLRLRGQFDAAHQIYLDNRMLDGRPGYHVIAPFRHAGGVVLVNRGWLALGDRAAPPMAPTPTGEMLLEGKLARARMRYVELSGATVQGRIWQNLDLARMCEYVGAPLADILVLQTSAAADGLKRQWPRPDTGVEKHLSYAVQWFALSATIAVLYGYFRLRKT